MPIIPNTSATLLNLLASSSQHVRWNEFVKRYQPMMTRYLNVHFPKIDAEEIIQETLIALIEILPNYHYQPEETGRFHNYLTGILRNKALGVVAKQTRKREVFQRYLTLTLEQEFTDPQARLEQEQFERAIYEIAMDQLVADESVHARTKQIFIAVAIENEDPECVAKRFGVSRNAVDQVKWRMVLKLKEYVARLRLNSSSIEPLELLS